MIICIDVGNTTILFGTYDNEKLIDTYRMETKILKTSDEYGSSLLAHYQINDINKKEVTGAIVSSVVPSVDHALEKMLVDYFKIKPIFVNTNLPLGLDILIDPKNSLEADLLVGSFIATQKYGCPNIVIDMGTATTIIVVNEDKQIIGGMIYPGVKEAFRSLVKSTSLLESTKLEAPSKPIENTTKSCLQSGMYYGTSCLIEGVVNKYKYW
jgi:type III pantothenate kinase